MLVRDIYVERAIAFATEAHAGQVRKYTGESYINHPMRVAATVASVSNIPDMHAAAILHDPVEDTDVTLEDIFNNFNPIIVVWVESLTKITGLEGGNRKTRHKIELERLSNAYPPAKTIKLADIIDNTPSIDEHDPEFAKIYIPEKREQLHVLVGGDAILMQRAYDIIDGYFETVEGAAS